MREDFAREGVVRYDVAYMATAVTATRSRGGVDAGCGGARRPMGFLLGVCDASSC